MSADKITRDTIFFTPEELIARWRNRVKLKTLACWRSTKQGPTFVKIGAKPLYPIEAVIEYERTGKIN